MKTVGSLVVHAHFWVLSALRGCSHAGEDRHCHYEELFQPDLMAFGHYKVDGSFSDRRLFLPVKKKKKSALFTNVILADLYMLHFCVHVTIGMNHVYVYIVHLHVQC